MSPFILIPFTNFVASNKDLNSKYLIRTCQVLIVTARTQLSITSFCVFAYWIIYWFLIILAKPNIFSFKTIAKDWPAFLQNTPTSFQVKDIILNKLWLCFGARFI